MITSAHSRTSRKGVADPAHLGMNRDSFHIEWFRRLVEIEMNRIIASILSWPHVWRWQDMVRGTLETRHEHRAADALQRRDHSFLSAFDMTEAAH